MFNRARLSFFDIISMRGQRSLSISANVVMGIDSCYDIDRFIRVNGKNGRG